ncbi:hypothetical protein M3589_15170 [Heyndrickxia oleronia]|uniref:hypothetical protein n=1 Tax=Heyndrickxia oleronia TaxID=38875 RepID=UPI00203BB212|nr:hypothetical protein [Heyndrickxia oleronia]MCM3239063.1 hypothetical protein [Heyndrickxia oleronia]
MNPETVSEFFVCYEKYKEQRTSIPTKEDLLLEMIKMFFDATTKTDKKRAAKLLLKSKTRLIEYGFWKNLNEQELNDLFR